MTDHAEIGLGGGCHWCTEAVFQPLKGVSNVRQGFICSDAPHETWSEAVALTFDATQISLHDLIGVHLSTHASTSDHKMRGKYRSAIYTHDRAQAARCRAVLADLATHTNADFVTRVLPLRGFRASDEQFRNYYLSNPAKPFCQTYIAPKLAKIRARYGALLEQDHPAS